MKNLKNVDRSQLVEWILRIAIFGEFFGHGVFAWGVKENWVEYFTSVGISADMALQLMPIIGAIDMLLAVLVLIRPVPVFLIWMAAWGFITALIRPIAGDPIWDFVERWANWGAPLALFFLIKKK